MLTALRKALTTVFPEQCFLSRLRVEEKQRIFSLRPARGEAAIGIRIDHNAMNWPREQLSCDALFVCASGDSNALVLVFVELKGSHVEDALNQIIESARALCRNGTPVRNVHVPIVIGEVQSLRKSGHGKAVLGVIVSKQGLLLKQAQRKHIWKHYGIQVWIVTGELSGVTCAQLLKKMGPPSR